jgi:hypothetical protein
MSDGQDRDAARLKTLLPFLCVCLAASAAHAAPTEWLEGTVLADCPYCKTEEFAAERRAIANQAGTAHDSASGTGYVVTLDGESRSVWGRAALVGTGNLIRTDAHVLFTDTGLLKTPNGRMYFEPMHHGGASDLIEIDLNAIQRGGRLGPLETDVKNDWAIARLREDAIEKFGGERVFAFLWDLRVTHDEIVKPDHARASALILGPEHVFQLHESCQTVTDDHPSNYWFGVEEVFFVGCPSDLLQTGSSGSALAILTADGTWNLGGQLIAGEMGTHEGAGRSRAQQLFLGNAPMLRQTLTIAYLKELVRRGMDPRNR